jgi:N-acetylneuraminic acid mutarotase
MIVWGGIGTGSALLNDGGRYNPAGNSWTAVSTTSAPGGRYNHTAVWTGTEMIVWGGTGPSDALNDGGRYNPAVNSWTAMSTTGAPTARYLHTAVWTGTEMIVWGGYNNTYLNDTFSCTPGRVMYLYQRP